MNTLEKLAYLKGLVEGLALDETKKDTKVIYNLIGLLEDVVVSLAALEGNVTEMQQQIDAVDEDLGDLEKELFSDECDCETCGAAHDEPCDEIYYEVTCPTCGNVIHLDDDMVALGEIDCPNCGEKLEYDLEG